MATQQEQKQWRVIVDLLSNFDVAMLTTMGEGGTLHARPMYVASRTREGMLSFVTSTDTEKADEIVSNSRALVTLQSSDKYVALNGHAALSASPERIARLWKPHWEAWFPRGKEDPSLALIDFVPEHGEYWDESGRGRVRFSWETIKSLFAGQTISPEAVHGEATPG